MNDKKVRPFGMRDKMGYLFGDFGNDFTFILSTMILTKFYTDVMGVSAAVVGTIMMLARFVDAVTDVTMGRICDRSKLTPAGKFKPWILRMCVPVAIASFLMYQSALADLPTNAKIIYLAITYILWGSFCYTGINIPYGSMASAISSDPSDRQSLSTFRTMGGMLAGMVIGILLPILAYDKVKLADAMLKLKDGCLVVENAGLIAMDKFTELVKLAEPANNNVILILTGEKGSITRLLETVNAVAGKFENKIDILGLGNKDMLAIARGYISQRGFKAEESVDGTIRNQLMAMESGNIDRMLKAIDDAMLVCEARESAKGNSGKKYLLSEDFKQLLKNKALML